MVLNLLQHRNRGRDVENGLVDTEGMGAMNWESICCCRQVAQSRPTLCDPIDGSPPGSPFSGILQARILEWGAIAFSRGSSQPRDWTLVSGTGRRILYCWATRATENYFKYFANVNYWIHVANLYSGYYHLAYFTDEKPEARRNKSSPRSQR